MDWQRIRITAETAAIRGRTLVSIIIALAGLALVVIGGINLLNGGVWAPYRSLLSGTFGITSVAEQQLVYVADVVVIGIGAVVVWLA